MADDPRKQTLQSNSPQPSHEAAASFRPMTEESHTVDDSPRGVLTRTFQAFRYKDFRLLWSGAFLSTTGTWMQNVAQSWLILEMTGSAFYLGLIGFLADLPILLFSLVGGVVADRFDRR